MSSLASITGRLPTCMLSPLGSAARFSPWRATPVRVAVSSPCFCGVHVPDLVDRDGAADLPSPSAEAAGEVKRSASAPPLGRRAAVLLTPTDVRS
jgi:hypothetical protein